MRVYAVGSCSYHNFRLVRFVPTAAVTEGLFMACIVSVPRRCVGRRQQTNEELWACGEGCARVTVLQSLGGREGSSAYCTDSDLYRVMVRCLVLSTIKLPSVHCFCSLKISYIIALVLVIV